MTSRSSKPIVLSGVSAVAFKAREEFERTTDLPNPFKKDREWYLNTVIFEDCQTGGISIKHCEPKNPDIHPSTKEEKDIYIRARDEFVSKRILWHCGWKEYETYCKNNNLPVTDLPCEGPDGQCAMWCSEFGKCSLSEIEK